MNHPFYDDPTTPVSEANRDVAYLYPAFFQTLDALLDVLHNNGLNVYIFEGRRTFDRQHFLYRQGRTSPGKIITNAGPGLSAHNYGVAADLVFKTPWDKGEQWTWDGNYELLGEIVKQRFPQLEWAGTWKRFPEMPHVQMTVGFSIPQIMAEYDRVGKGPQGIKAVWDMFDQARAREASGMLTV